ncbi:hypothetical protein NDU88_005399 [Pleurodeles waltl]|uniref:Uncharacterized protein n=1 Tax=Pleurodeles waltl TaxID=8319 RepID=A0AAV7L0M9_PLEWA|nr:hypothetical protein NDU88_005399 [Pleurodeles waltl]
MFTPWTVEVARSGHMGPLNHKLPIILVDPTEAEELVKVLYLEVACLEGRASGLLWVLLPLGWRSLPLFGGEATWAGWHVQILGGSSPLHHGLRDGWCPWRYQHKMTEEISVWILLGKEIK